MCSGIYKTRSQNAKPDPKNARKFFFYFMIGFYNFYFSVGKSDIFLKPDPKKGKFSDQRESH